MMQQEGTAQSSKGDCSMQHQKKLAELQAQQGVCRSAPGAPRTCHLHPLGQAAGQSYLKRHQNHDQEPQPAVRAVQVGYG